MRTYLLAHASTTAMRRASFAGDEPVDEYGAIGVRDFGPLPRLSHAVHGRSWRTRQTADTLGATAAACDERLKGSDVGTWAGMTLEQISALNPLALQT